MTPLVPNSEIELFALAMEAAIGVLQPERTIEDNTRIREQNRANLADNKKQARYYSYALKALDSACSAISSASQGDKHAAIFRYSAHIGNHVAAGMIGESECYSALVSAGIATGYRQNEVERTVNDALRAGMSKPTDTNELDRKWAQKLADWKRQRAIQKVNESPRDLFGHVINQLKNEVVIHSEMLTKMHVKKMGVSWYGEQNIPLATISALLHLTDTRSDTVAVMGNLHEAFLACEINPGAFTYQDVKDYFGDRWSERVIRNALDDLVEFNYLRDLKGLNIDTIVPLDTAINSVGRPPRTYCIADDKLVYSHIPERLEMSMDIYWREKMQHNTLSELTPELAACLDLADYEALKKTRDMAQMGVMQDRLSKEAARGYKLEMDGDGKEWGGWGKALRSGYTIPIDWSKCDTSKDVRAAIIEYWITHVRAVNSQSELMRLIGCSSATLSSIYRDYNIASVPQSVKYTLTVSEIGRDLRDKLRELQQKHRGIIWKVRFKHRYQKHWMSSTPEYAAYYYAQHINDKDAPIEQVFIILNTPSEQHVMTEAEIKERDEKLAETEPKPFPTLAPVNPVTPVTKQKRTGTYSKPSRQWRGHDFTYLYKWVQLFTFMFTESLTLEGDTLVDNALYAPGNVILKSQDLSVILKTVLTYTDGTMHHTSADYHGIEIEDWNSDIIALFKQRRSDELAQAIEDSKWQEIHTQAALITVPF